MGHTNSTPAMPASMSLSMLPRSHHFHVVRARGSSSVVASLSRSTSHVSSSSVSMKIRKSDTSQHHGRGGVRFKNTKEARLAKQLAKCDTLSEIENLLTPMQTKDMSSKELSFMLGAICRRHGEPERALQALRHLESTGAPVHNVYSYTAVLSGLGRAGCISQAQALLASMDDVGLEADTAAHNAVLAALAKEARWQDAEALTEQMRSRGVPRDVYTYTSIVHALGRAGHWQRARVLVRNMVRGRLETRPNVVTFSALMGACLACDEPAAAMATFHDMELCGVRPDAKALTHFFTACRAVDPPQGARALDIFRTQTECRDGVQPVTSTYNALIAALGSAGLCDDALAVLDEMEEADMEERSPNGITYNAALFACARAGRASDARLLCARMDAAGVGRDAVTYAELLRALARGGCLRESLQILDELEQGVREVRPNLVVYNVMLAECARSIGASSDDVDDDYLLSFVDRTVSSMESAGGDLSPDPFTRRAHLLALENANEWRRAAEVSRSTGADLDILRGVVYRGVDAARITLPLALEPLRTAANAVVASGRRARELGARELGARQQGKP